MTGCSDKSSFCKNWASRGYCDPNHQYSKYMAKNCLKTCNLCALPPPLPSNLPPAGKSGYQ